MAIEDKPGLVVIIVSREGTVLATEVVHEPIEDMVLTDSPPLRPMPYGLHRTSIEDIRLTKEEGSAASNGMQEN